MIFDSSIDTVVFAVLVILIGLLFSLKSKEIHSWKQYILAERYIHHFLKKQKKKLIPTDLRRNDLSPIDIGLVPSAAEYELENPYKTAFQHCDGIHFAGISSDENMIDVCINRIEKNLALVWVLLKLSNGKMYKLPFNTDTRKAYIASENMFSSSGLQIKCLSPLRKWRISFNGLLQNCCNSKHEEELIHVKFSFVWLAMSVVQEMNFLYNAKELSSSCIRAAHEVEEKDLIRFHELQNRYEQWGQMIGTIHFAGEDEREFYFWSSRTRIYDTPLWNEDIMCAKFYMYFKDGIPLKIEGISIEGFLSNLVNGFTISAYGAAKLISNCNFKIHQLKNSSKEMHFSLDLNGEAKYLQICFAEDNAFYMGPELQYQLVLRPFKVQMTGSDPGYGILHYLSRSNKEKNIFQPPPLLLMNPGYSTSEKLVLHLEEKVCKSSHISGGKGSSLALLTELSEKTSEFIVPKGIIISTRAFENHLESNRNLYNAIQKLNDVSCQKLKADLKTECDICASEFVSTHLSESLKNEIEHNLLELYDSLENVRFSIRSSACGEDSEDFSAAGQMLTVLGVRGIDSIFQAIIRCWSSKFCYEYVQYSRQNGQSILSPMAVVVQEMVPSEYSGVIFTVDPVTGDPTRPCITANYGLGETVVSALADPDTIILKRSKDQSLQVSNKQIGSKKTQVFMQAGDGLEKKNFENVSENSCLTDEWAVKIGNIGILVESCFCSPRDIEWAVYKDQIYLLQARPITTLHNETDFELIHDQDTPVRSDHDFWTRANTGEVFLGATSPLGISLIAGGMDIYGHRSQVLRQRIVDEFCPYFLHILPVTHRQITLNVIDTIFKSNEKEISSSQKAFEVAIFGRSVLTEKMHQLGVKKYGYMTKRAEFIRLPFLLILSLKMPKSASLLNAKLSKYRVPLENYTSTKKAWDGILGQMDYYAEACSVHGMTTFLSMYLNMMLITILSKGKNEWDNELYCDFATMLSACTGVESADVPESLQVLAKTIAMDHGKEFSSLSSSVAYSLLKNDTGTAGKLFDDFIKCHGHRCVKEFDLYSKSWGMQPESMIPTLQNMVGSPNIANIATKEVMTTEDIISKIKTPISSFNKRILKLLLPYSRKYVCLRENSKSMLIKTVDWLRKSCYHLGDLMVKEGMLPDSELVFFLSAEEVIEVLTYQKPGLVSKAVRRRRLHPQLNDLKFPEIMEGIPKPVQVQHDYSSYSASFTLTGYPVCQGKVKGKAIVVLSLEEASKIKSGDILITHATDIGWSPYFPLLSGVVTVLGGLISHGAVVAREYGLPCVVGVENATVAFKSGDTVILNGTNGTVTKILDEDQ